MASHGEKLVANEMEAHDPRSLVFVEVADDGIAEVDAEILDVGRTRLAHPEPVQPEQDRHRGVVVVNDLSGKELLPELRAVEPTSF